MLCRRTKYFENETFELIFKTIISKEVQTYVYKGKINPSGKTTIELGDGIAVLKNFNSKKMKLIFVLNMDQKLECSVLENNTPILTNISRIYLEVNP